MIVRQKCKIDGCESWGEYRGTVRGIKRYRALCEIHRRPRRKNRKPFDLSKCQKCGKADSCERHRFGGQGTVYSEDNVIVLCKACHRKVHKDGATRK